MKKKMARDFLLSFVVAFVAWVVLLAYISVVMGDISRETILAWLTPKKLLLFVVLFAAAFVSFWSEGRCLEYLFRYRYTIVGILFVCCVAVGITGSSIGKYCAWFGTEETDVLLGISRSIRSDEWAVSTPMAWSQYYGDVPFSYFSSIVRGTETDVFLEYGQAVADWMILFRPFYIGYLFLPIANGMAFFWCGRFLALLLVSFEFGRLLTKDKRLLALVYAALIALSPVVQWWFATNGLVEMLIYVQLSILVLRDFMLTKSYIRRVGLVLVAVICAGGYILTFYPAWQVPLAYVLLALIVWTILEYKDNCVMRGRDYLTIAGGIVLLAIAMVCIMYKSRDTITSLLNTVYPGKRRATGGGQLGYLFNYVFSIWMTLFGDSPVSNTCECAYFIDLFPLCYIVTAVALLKQKKKDKLLVCMLLAGLALGSYCVFGFPEWLAKVTLLNYSTGNRALVALGLCNVMLLIRGIAAIRELRISVRAVGGVLALGLAVLAVYGGYRLNPDWYSNGKLFAMFALFGTLFVCCIYASKKACFRLWAGAMLVTVFLAGGLVNPIRVGTSDVEQIPELQAVKSIVAEDNDALWVVDGMDFMRQDALLLVGAPTVNSTSIYPNLKLWHSLDTGENEYIYNRYAHITVNIIEDGEAGFELTFADAFTVNLTLENLKAMNVKYIFTEQELTGRVTLLEKVNSYYIYQME